MAKLSIFQKSRITEIGIALHTSLGFQQVGLLPEAIYKFGEWHRMLIMQRLL